MVRVGFVLASRGISFDALRFLNCDPKAKAELFSLLHGVYLIAFDKCYDANGVFRPEDAAEALRGAIEHMDSVKAQRKATKGKKQKRSTKSKETRGATARDVRPPKRVKGTPLVFY